MDGWQSVEGWQLATASATGRVTSGRQEKEGERLGAGMQEQTHTLHTRGEDFDSLILPCAALIRKEIPPLQRR